MKIGFLEPHLRCYGGIRRVLELANRLVGRGHEVRFYLSPGAVLGCDWMECRAEVRSIAGNEGDELDVLIFNHEPQWFQVSRFSNVRRRVFYVLHYAALYDKAGVHESLRYPVHLRLANSRWTAEQAAAECGELPTVLLGGINEQHFRPIAGKKRWPVLAYGDRSRAWKGTADIDRACEILSLRPEYYAGRGYPQEKMAEVYGAAEVFVTASWFEGFSQPGLEALACGTPLVTTDCGGALEYAFDGETALVVPPRDPEALAEAIRRLRSDPALRTRLRENGLRCVREKFSWDRNAERLESMLETLLAEPDAALGDRPRHGAPVVERNRREPVELSVLTQVDGDLDGVQSFLENVRRHTDVPYEVIAIDSSDEPFLTDYLRLATEHTVRAVGAEATSARTQGMAEALRAARGSAVAVFAPSTRVPPGWARRLLETLRDSEDTGVVVPALGAADREVGVRETAGSVTTRLTLFADPPSAVAVCLRAADARALTERGTLDLSAPDADLSLSLAMGSNGLATRVDERVLVTHVLPRKAGIVPLEQRLADRRATLERWGAGAVEVPNLGRVGEREFPSLLSAARGAAGWMLRTLEAAERSASSSATASVPRSKDPGSRDRDWKRSNDGRRSWVQKKWRSIEKRLFKKSTAGRA